MPTIRFSFQGYMTTEVNKVYDLQQGKDIDVSNMPADELVKKLKAGNLAIIFNDAYDNSTDLSENELFDYENADGLSKG